jgi:hypothetical protein
VVSPTPIVDFDGQPSFGVYHEAQPILESLVTDAERFAWMSDEDFHGFVLKSIASSM